MTEQKQQSSQQQKSVITFKPTSTGYAQFTHDYNPEETVQNLKDLLATHYSVQYSNIKLIHKGRVLADKQTCSDAKLENAVVMLVINKKAPTKPQPQDNTIHKIPSSFNTGMGGSSPVGFGGYGLINHPQYMSAISGAVNEQNIEQMLNDPQYSSMMEEMLKDPETMKYMIEENPMLRNMVRENPSMKVIFDNPQLMKMVFNPQTMKMARNMMKNQNNGGTLQGEQNNNANNGLGALGGLGGLGTMTGNNPGNTMPGTFPGFGFPNFGAPNANLGGLGGLGMGGLGGLGGFGGFPMNQPTAYTQPPAQQQPQQIPIEQKYASQLRELESMGFKDREQMIKALIESKGDVDGAIERLCKD